MVLEDYFNDADILVMTVDGCLQLISGKSPFSNLVANHVIPLAVVDEVQALDACKVAAISCNVEAMLSFFDPAQTVDRSCDRNFRYRDAGQNQGCDFFRLLFV